MSYCLHNSLAHLDRHTITTGHLAAAAAGPGLAVLISSSDFSFPFSSIISDI